MSNVIAFPDARSIEACPESIFDEVLIRAYVESHARKSPERVIEISMKLKLATKAAELLHILIEEINTEIKVGPGKKI